MNALLVVNPKARGLPRQERLRAAAAWLEEAGWQVRLQPTEGPGHATALAQAVAQQGYDLVVACGGDGTINEVVNGLAGSPTALGVVPGGTANVWAKEAGIPRDPLKAIAIAAQGESRRIDLGRAMGRAIPLRGSPGPGGLGKTERHFLLMAGLGFDGHVIHCLSLAAKERWGALAYILTGLREGVSYRGREARISLDGEAFTTDLLFMVAGNTRSYGGVLEITRQARLDDGLLDVCLLTDGGLPRKLGHLLRLLARAHIGAPGTLYRRARRVEVDGPEPIFVQVDGELCGAAPIAIEAVPQALTVKLPPGGARKLLGS